MKRQQLHSAKKLELILRKQIDSDEWEEVFSNTHQSKIKFDQRNEIAQKTKQHFEEFLEIDRKNA